MPNRTGLWLRREVSAHEQRTPLVPADAAALVAAGVDVTVEQAPQRIFPIDQYVAAGCRIMPTDTWPSAPPDTFVLGVKEPGPAPRALKHRHVFFGHTYKGQTGAAELLGRFVAGNGTLLDLEALVDDDGRRLVAFGFWAGYVGAALAVLHHRGELTPPLRSTTREQLDALLRQTTASERALVIGALGRSGRGAREALATAGVCVTAWDVDETRTLDRARVVEHDILVNTVFADGPGPPFLTVRDLTRSDRQLRTVSDVTCDVTSACNRLPVNDQATSWAAPARALHSGPRPLDILAVDNLPSLIPRESSAAFSADLMPHLVTLADGSPVWQRCQDRFRNAVNSVNAVAELAEEERRG